MAWVEDDRILEPDEARQAVLAVFDILDELRRIRRLLEDDDGQLEEDLEE